MYGMIFGISKAWVAGFLLSLAGMAFADDLSTARSALRDRLYPIARKHAETVLQAETAEKSAVREALLILLESYAREGNYREVLARVSTAKATGQVIGDDVEVAYWTAQALLAVGDLGQAASLAATETNRPSTRLDSFLRILARVEVKRGNSANALQLFKLIDTTSSNSVTRADNALEWAQTLLQQDKRQEALQVLQHQSELPAVTDSVSRGKLMRGRLLMQDGKTTEAASLLSQLSMDAHADESSRVEALLEMSVFSWNGGQTNEAVAFARTALARASQRETRHLAGFRLGDLLIASPETLAEGASLIRKLIREDPESQQSMRAMLKVADAFLRLDKPKEAADEYKIFLETYPASSLDSRVLEGRGYALLKLGQYAAASTAFGQAADRSTQGLHRVQCRLKQADALVADKQFSEAATVYEKTYRANTNSPLAAFSLFQSADALERAQQTKEAITRFGSVIRAFPQDEIATEAMLRLASLQTKSEQYADAIQTYTDVVASKFANKQTLRTAWMERGKVLYRIYRFSQALQDFAAVAEDPGGERDEARFLMILCIYGLGRDGEAKSAASAFLVDFPQSARLPDLILWLGKFSFNHGEFATAQKYFLEFITRWPENRWTEFAAIWAARSAFSASDFTGCVDLISKFRSLRPNSPRILEAMLIQANALIELARFDEAILLLDRLIILGPESEWGHQALLRKGDCLFTMGASNETRYEESLQAYRKRLEKSDLPESAVLQLHFKMARCLEKLRRRQDAIDEYYAGVIVRYLENREKQVWMDDSSTALFLRSVLTVSELYEQQGEREQAIRVLRKALPVQGGGSEELKQRIDRLEKGQKAGV